MPSDVSDSEYEGHNRGMSRRDFLIASGGAAAGALITGCGSVGSGGPIEVTFIPAGPYVLGPGQSVRVAVHVIDNGLNGVSRTDFDVSLLNVSDPSVATVTSSKDPTTMLTSVLITGKKQGDVDINITVSLPPVSGKNTEKVHVLSAKVWNLDHIDLGDQPNPVQGLTLALTAPPLMVEGRTDNFAATLKGTTGAPGDIVTVRLFFYVNSQFLGEKNASGFGPTSVDLSTIVPLSISPGALGVVGFQVEGLVTLTGVNYYKTLVADYKAAP